MNTSEIQKAITKAAAHALAAFLAKRFKRIEERLKLELHGLLKATRTYDALINGPLDAHFGLPQGEAQSRADAIIQKISQQIKVFDPQVTLHQKTFNGKFKIGFILKDFFDIMTMAEAHVWNEGTKEFLPWLEWLIIKGDEVFILSKVKPEPHYISINNYPKSRSGKAMMKKIKPGKQVWKVPSEYSGTATDNWFIKALLDNVALTRSIVIKIVQEELS